MLGALWRRDLEYFKEAPWRTKKAFAGGGVLFHQSIHLIDLLQWYFGPVKFVEGYIDNLLYDFEVEDVASALIQFKNGVIATILTTTSPVQNPPELTISSTKGIVNIKNFKEGGEVTLLELTKISWRLIIRILVQKGKYQNTHVIMLHKF